MKLANSILVVISVLLLAYTAFSNFKLPPSPVSETYFPTGVFSANIQDNEFYDNLWSEDLRLMDEPSFIQKIESESLDKSIRLTYLRSFDNPVCITITPRKNDSIVVFKDYDAQLEKLKSYKRIEKKEYFVEASEKLDSHGFEYIHPLASKINSWYWDKKSKTWSAGRIMTMDGATFIVERAQENSYHMVIRQTGHENEIFQTIKEEILKFKIDIGKFY